MTSIASRERQGLCDTFERVGPDAPTLCSPWLTRDLAAHLIVRERRPDVAAAIFIPPLAGRLKRVQDGYAAWNWPRLVDQVRSGPPRWSPMSLPPMDKAINTVEFFVHHEDVLRGGADWSARELPGEVEQALWGILPGITRVSFARSQVGVRLVAPSYGQRLVHAETDLGTVVVKGTPGELLLYCAGRKGVAQVEVSGSEKALAAI